MAQRLAGRAGYPKDEPFRVTLQENRLDDPLSWRKPRTCFVCSMGDLFHDAVPYSYIDRVFRTIAYASHETPGHIFIVLTKRAERMHFYVKPWDPPLPNVWLGVTAENQKRADERIPWLLKTPAAVRFVSVEPLLEAMNISQWLGDNYSSVHGGFDSGIMWTVVGAETGPGKRPMCLSWADDLRQQCEEANIPFFFKKNSAGTRHLGGCLYEQWPKETT